MSEMFTEELDFMEDDSSGPEVIIVSNINYSGKSHICTQVFEVGELKGLRVLCKNGNMRGKKRFGISKLSEISCKICQKAYEKNPVVYVNIRDIPKGGKK